MAGKIMVFGVFDSIHKGHRALFKFAKRYGNYLVIALARDNVVRQLKGLPPRKNFAERTTALKKEKNVDKVIRGDSELGSWEVIKKYKPDVIAIGYDQKSLKKNMKEWMKNYGRKPKVITIKAYKPYLYHNSLLRPRK